MTCQCTAPSYELGDGTATSRCTTCGEVISGGYTFSADRRPERRMSAMSAAAAALVMGGMFAGPMLDRLPREREPAEHPYAKARRENRKRNRAQRAARKVNRR